MNPDRIEMFEKYSSNNMQNREKVDFEKQLDTDVLMKQDYEAFLQVKNSIQYTKNVALKKKINAMLEQSDSKRARIKRITFLYAAASILIVCCFSFYLFWESSKTASLYSEFYKPYTETTSVLSNEKSGLMFCLNDYNKEEYHIALECLKKLSVSSNQLFYKGMCHMNLENTELAIEALLQVEKSGESFQEEANWYLALLYLRQDNIEETKKRLQQILEVSNSNYQKSSAKKLLFQLDHLE